MWLLGDALAGNPSQAAKVWPQPDRCAFCGALLTGPSPEATWIGAKVRFCDLTCRRWFFATQLSLREFQHRKYCRPARCLGVH